MLNTRMIVGRYGGPEVLEMAEEPLRAPGPGEIRIKVKSSGVALADVMRREGLYPNSPKPPFTPGYEAVGIVDELGDNVRGYSIGDVAGAFYAGTGGYSSYVYAGEAEAFRVPAAVAADEAAALILNYVTAYQMLHRQAKIAEGDNILIHGASGGVGTALLELGRLAGANLFGTASAAKHGILKRFGALPIDYREEDFVEVLARTAPEGMDAVFDPIGGDNWRRSDRTLASGGRFVGYGYTSVLGGGSDTADWMKEWSTAAGRTHTENGHPAHLYSITSWKLQHPGWFGEDLQALFLLLQEGKIKPLISHRIPLRDAAHAHDLLERSQSIGKIILTSD